jgi:hypothetical protein
VKCFKLSAAIAAVLAASFGYAAEYYPDTKEPGAGLNWRVSGEVRDTTGALVALASPDTELKCNGGDWEDASGESSIVGTGGFTFEYDHSAETAAYTGTPSMCRSGTILIKGTNNVPIAIPFTADYGLNYAGTISGYDDTTPSGCDAGGASLTLNTTDQVGSTANGEYDGMWIEPVFGTGSAAPNNGRWASTAYTYDGTNKILCVDVPFETALVGASTVVHIYSGYARTPVTTSAIASANATATRDMTVEDQGGGVSLGCAMAVLLAYAAGDLVTTGGSSTYEDPSGTETRITGTVSSAGNRLAAAGCPTY